MPSPIVLFAYNRPEHTRKTLDVLSASNLAAQSELYIFADGQKENCTPENLEKIKATRAVYFSIVVPVHNRERTLKLCIDSILSQSYKDFELILVDDHSTDDSVKTIKEYQKKDSRIILVEQPNEKHGAQAARNAGIKISKYNWIMFNDSDDAWHADKIQKEYEILKKENFADDLCIYSDCIVHNIKDDSEKLWDLPLISKENSYKDLLMTSGPMFQSLVCSKKHLEEAGWLDENVPAYQEWDASLSLAKNGRFIKINDPLFTYYVGSNDAISKSVKKELLGRHYIYSKYKNDIIANCGTENYKNRYENLFRYFIDNYISFPDWNKNDSLCDFLNICLVELGRDLLEREKANNISGKRLIKLLIKKTFLYRVLRKLKHMYRGGVENRYRKRLAVKNETEFLFPTRTDNEKLAIYQLSFFAEFFQYFDARVAKLKMHGKKVLCIYNMTMAHIYCKYSFDEYFKQKIKSPERALIRKAMKNNFYCSDICYDDFLDDIFRINTSKAERQGHAMEADYVNYPRKRESVIKSIGQTIYSFGCFNEQKELVAYYMFELYGNTFHTVKGIGHKDYLPFGIMNYLFAYSVSRLSEIKPGSTILYGGWAPHENGVGRFKKNVGCTACTIVFEGGQEFLRKVFEFNKKYKIHGDTGLNFMEEYLK